MCNSLATYLGNEEQEKQSRNSLANYLGNIGREKRW